MNLSKATDIEGYFDFARVESIELFTYTTGACNKLRYKVVMTMFSGTKHRWGEYVEDKKVAEARRNALLNAVKAARK